MMVDYKELPDKIQEYDREWARKVMALYTRPTKRLSDDEIRETWYSLYPMEGSNYWDDALNGVYLTKFARAIENKLLELNNGNNT